MAKTEAASGIDISQCVAEFGLEAVSPECFTKIENTDSCGYQTCDSYQESLKACFAKLKLKPADQQRLLTAFPCFIVPYIPLYDKIKEAMMKVKAVDDNIGNYSTVANALSTALTGAVRKDDRKLIQNVSDAIDATLKNNKLEDFIKFISGTEKLQTLLPSKKGFDDTNIDYAVLLIIWTKALLANDPMAEEWETKYAEDAIKYFPLKAIK